MRRRRADYSELKLAFAYTVLRLLCQCLPGQAGRKKAIVRDLARLLQVDEDHDI